MLLLSEEEKTCARTCLRVSLRVAGGSLVKESGPDDDLGKRRAAG